MLTLASSERRQHYVFIRLSDGRYLVGVKLLHGNKHSCCDEAVEYFKEFRRLTDIGIAEDGNEELLESIPVIQQINRVAKISIPVPVANCKEAVAILKDKPPKVEAAKQFIEKFLESNVAIILDSQITAKLQLN